MASICSAIKINILNSKIKKINVYYFQIIDFQNINNPDLFN